jgi:hypothetical protein
MPAPSRSVDIGGGLSGPAKRSEYEWGDHRASGAPKISTYVHSCPYRYAAPAPRSAGARMPVDTGSRLELR